MFRNRVGDISTLRREFVVSESTSERTRVLTAIGTGALLYGLFGVLDASFYPEHLNLLIPVRLFVVTSFLILFVIIRRSTSYWPFVLASAGAWVIGAVGIAAMCHLTEGYSSPYYAGIPLCAVVVAAICAWPWWLAVVSFAISLAAYYGPLFFGASIEDPKLFLLHGAFILSTFSLSLVGFNVRERLAFQAFTGQKRLEERNRELARLHDSKNRMFQNVSHELRTPLTLMLGPLERRIRGQSNFGANREGVETLHRHGLRLLKLINDLLDLAQLTTEELPVARKTIELRRFVRLLIEDARIAADARNLKLIEHLPPSAVFYSVDPRHLEKILLNLLSNAIKFTEPGGTIQVRFETGLTSLRIRVFDDGPGIGEADQRRIFERFEQAENEIGSEAGGAGIGLALVRELAELLEGTVTVESTLGEGSCFTVALPARYLQARPENEGLETPTVEAGLDQKALRSTLHRATAPERIVCGHRGARILIAEDDPDLRLQLAELLQDRHRIVAVSDGEAALAEARAFLPHLVITDLMMPKLDGIELCRRLRQELEFHRTAVLMLTARGALGDRVDGRSAGADTYLTKPFDTQELLSAVRGLLKARMHVVGEFLLHQRLGRGGQSTVFMAEHLISGQAAAVKVISTGVGPSAKRRAQIRIEMQALARLDHPNIVRILADYEQEGTFFLAMEYLSGTSIHSCLEEFGALTTGEAAAIALGVAKALHHTHENGLVHRDVKCSNVILTSRPGDLSSRTRLIDFGSATILGSSYQDHQGTPEYMAPELLDRSQAASIQSDLYSLGLMLLRMCTGHAPYDSRRSMSSRRRPSATPVGLDHLTSASEELRPILVKTMALEPRDRWSSAIELADALVPFADQNSVLASEFRESRGGVLTPTHPLTPFDALHVT